MIKSMVNQDKLQITIDTKDLGPAQVRLIRSLNTAISEVLRTRREGELFEQSAEIFRIMASLIQMSRFIDENRQASTIPYDKQAIEFALDVLDQQINNSEVIKYDN